MTLSTPEFTDVQAAAKRLAGHAVRTPILSHPMLDERAGGPVLIKPECLQRTGSFKFRGAYNAISKLGDSARPGGVVAFSSGNHAQGVAEAARLLDLPAIIVMPSDAPEVKKAGVLARGAEVRLYDRETEDREAIAAALCAERGAALIPAFDHPDIIAGQGTTGLEVFEELQERGVSADQLVCCVGGGGLIAGIGLAARALSPATQVWGAEPAGFDDHARSLKSGQIERNAHKSGSICDALMAEAPGRLTFQLNQRQLSGVGVVSDDEVLAAMRFAFDQFKLVVEPGGAAALAAVLSGKIMTADKTTVVVLTGGNVDPAMYQRALSS